jgi:fructose-1,6-bisphosphatase/sedoheptulose 1,7-bisphosphatase-like protein
LLRGVRFFGDGTRTHTLVMTTVPNQVRFIDTIHAKAEPDVKFRF